MSRSRVFIPQYPMHWRRDGRAPAPKVDLSPAGDYGELITLLPGRPVPVASEVIPLLHAGLATFDAANDYVIAIGHPVLIAWTGMVLGHYTKTARVLDWDGEARAYQIVPLSITEGVNECLNQLRPPPPPTRAS